MQPNAHQGPFVTHERDTLVRSESLFHRIAQLTHGGRVVVEAIVALCAGIGENELRASLQFELLSPHGQQEALLLTRAALADALGANGDLPDLVVGLLKLLRGIEVALLRNVQGGASAFAPGFDS